MCLSGLSIQWKKISDPSEKWPHELKDDRPHGSLWVLRINQKTYHIITSWKSMGAPWGTQPYVAWQHHLSGQGFNCLRLLFGGPSQPHPAAQGIGKVTVLCKPALNSWQHLEIAGLKKHGAISFKSIRYSVYYFLSSFRENSSMVILLNHHSFYSPHPGSSFLLLSSQRDRCYWLMALYHPKKKYWASYPN